MKENRISEKLMLEWNYEKNKGIDPKKCTRGLKKKVWWRCEKGHEWSAAINQRVRGSGCPYCSGRCAIRGENDLATCYPDIVKEWNYDKNIGLTPEGYLGGSDKKVWWRCEKGHEWSAAINRRVRGKGCPYCSGRCAIRGENDLQTLYPDIAKEWNYEKNGELKPEDVLPKSNRKVSWKCSKGHEWETVVHARTNGSGCPYCQGKRPILGETDLTTVNPQLAAEWSSKNSKKPEEYTGNSGEIVWWICKNGHEWRNSIHSRNSNHTGCPYCAGQKPIKGVNDLATKNPVLVAEWDWEKNGKLKPSDCMPGSHAKVYWKCKKGHSWSASIYYRVAGYGCPYCKGRKPIVGETDLTTIDPQLAAEWSSKNSKKSEEYTAKSGEKVWWICKKGHEWKASIAGRRRGNGCPYCDGKIAIKGENDLATCFPDLAKEFDYEKNEKLTPDQITKGSGKKIYWKCKYGHSWLATVSSRVGGCNCPYCSGRRR